MTGKDEDVETIDLMKQIGGGFVKAIAEAAYKADGTNYQRLKAAFPEYWQQYGELVARKKEAKK